MREVAALQSEMSRMLNSVFAGDTNGQSRSWVPAVDVWESDDSVVYAFDLPGIPQDQISIEFEDNALTVSGERERPKEEAGERFYRYERRFGAFSRTIGLPQGVSEQDIKADYENGVLEVVVAKPKAPEPRRIQIGDSSTIEGTATKA
jgi:HSP20 family protein